jgi:hypothetical protein
MGAHLPQLVAEAMAWQGSRLPVYARNLSEDSYFVVLTFMLWRCARTSTITLKLGLRILTTLLN